MPSRLVQWGGLAAMLGGVVGIVLTYLWATYSDAYGYFGRAYFLVPLGLLLGVARVDFRGATFGKAYLQSAYLRRANLEEVRLRGLNLQGANLRDADLQGTDLQETQLHGADLRAAKNLVQEQIDRAYGDESTKLPEYLHLPSAWMQSTDDEQVTST